MSHAINRVYSRHQVLSDVVSAITNMSNERLSQVQSYLRVLEETADSRIRGEIKLSRREQEVLTLIANGYSRRQIGECLNISANTAARHIATIYSKLGVSTIAEATRYAIGIGLA